MYHYILKFNYILKSTLIARKHPVLPGNMQLKILITLESLTYLK